MKLNRIKKVGKVIKRMTKKRTNATSDSPDVKPKRVRTAQPAAQPELSLGEQLASVVGAPGRDAQPLTRRQRYRIAKKMIREHKSTAKVKEEGKTARATVYASQIGANMQNVTGGMRASYAGRSEDPAVPTSPSPAQGDDDREDDYGGMI